MKKSIIIVLALLAVAPVSSYASTDVFSVQQSIDSNDIKTLFDNEQYQQIVDTYAGRPRGLSTTELGYIALSYYKLDDVDKSLKYADMALQKDSKDLRIYTLKGMILNTQEKYNEAIEVFNKAIELSPREGELYTNLGDSYLAMKRYDEALANYQKAILQRNPSDRAYYMIGVAYDSMDNRSKALDAFYIAKSKVASNKELYVAVLYNIGLIEYANGDYAKALLIYDELLKYYPDDYQSYEKQIQCYYALDNYNKGDAVKAKLYKLYEISLPTGTVPYYQINTDFFHAGSKPVYVYERYQQPNEEYDKYIFFVMKLGSEDVDYQIVFRYEPNTNNYSLLKIKNGTEENYNLTYGLDLNYRTAKDFVIEKVK